MIPIRQTVRDLLENAKTHKRRGVTILALILVAIGIIGILIPLVPGILILLPGLILLSVYSPSIHGYLKRKAGKYPRIESMLDRTRNKLIHFIHPRG